MVAELPQPFASSSRVWQRYCMYYCVLLDSSRKVRTWLTPGRKAGNAEKAAITYVTCKFRLRVLVASVVS